MSAIHCYYISEGRSVFEGVIRRQGLLRRAAQSLLSVSTLCMPSRTAYKIYTVAWGVNITVCTSEAERKHKLMTAAVH
jgi:hypothetical protein